jgi:hypothetical protein
LLTRVAAPLAGISAVHDFVRALRQAVEQDLT